MHAGASMPVSGVAAFSASKRTWQSGQPLGQLAELPAGGGS
jgi:hypothetical protein